MSRGGAALLDLTALAELLRHVSDGSDEVLGALAEQPVLMVDLDTPGDPAGVDIPLLLPCVIVGIGCARTSPGLLAGVDIALTDADPASSPWVTVIDIDAAIRSVEDAVHRSPHAAVTLVQVLRSSRPDSLEHDLLLESLAYSALQAGPEYERWLTANPTTAPAAGAESPLVMERTGGRLSLTLNRPAVRNAYNAAMRDQLCEALTMVCSDPSIREVHIHGGGDDFCSGGDLVEFGTLADPTTAHLIRTSRSAARLLGMVGDRVVAHLHGACVGAGIELPALAGRVVAEPDTRLRLPEVSMGLIPGAGGTATIPRRIGRHRTAWLAVTGRSINAATGRAWGLIDEIVDL